MVLCLGVGVARTDAAEKWEELRKYAKSVTSSDQRRRKTARRLCEAALRDKTAPAWCHVEASLGMSVLVEMWDRDNAAAASYRLRAEKMLPKVEPPELRAQLLVKTADSYARKPWRRLPPAKVAAFYARTESLVAGIHPPGARLRVLLEFADYHYRTRCTEKLKEYCVELERLAPQVEGVADKVPFLFRLAGYEAVLGRREQITRCCAEAEKTVADIPSVVDRLPWLVKLAELYDKAGEPDEAVRVGSDARLLCADLKDVAGEAKCLLVVGRAYERKKKFDQAVRPFLKAARLTSDWSGFASAARCLAATGKTDQAFQVLKTAIAKRPAGAPGYRPGPGGAAEAKAFFDAMSESAARLLQERKSGEASDVLRVATCVLGRNANCLDQVNKAQADLVTALLLDGRKDEAVAEAKRYFYTCKIQDIASAIGLVARALKAADGEMNLRVRAFLDFQRYGPAGRDENPGTNDDLPNPLAKARLGRPSEYDLLTALTASVSPMDYRARGYASLLKGDADAALCEFRRAYAAAPGANITDVIYDIATAIKAVDGHVLRANRYLEHQKYGPAGKDGKAGTTDDLRNPLEAVPWSVSPDQLKAIEARIASCGSDYTGLRRKGRLLLSIGRAEEALKAMQDAFDLCDIDVAALRRAIMDVATAIKAVDGHMFRANEYLLYQKYGSAGKDGIKGTKDDLVNPLRIRAAKGTGKPG